MKEDVKVFLDSAGVNASVEMENAPGTAGVFSGKTDFINITGREDAVRNQRQPV